jgi:putative peptidoglycan lipid II flippase
MQVPETLIGTAIATALLPTLSEMAVREEVAELREKIVRTIKVMIALAIPISAILAAGLLPLIQLAFGFSTADAQIVMRTTQAFLIGVAGHSLVELAVRAFYAKQNAKVPMIAAASTFVVFLPLAIVLMLILGAPGIAMANSIVFSLQAIVLIILLGRSLQGKLSPGCSIINSLISGLVGALIVWLSLHAIQIDLPDWMVATMGMMVATVMAAIPIRRELRQLLKL